MKIKYPNFSVSSIGFSKQKRRLIVKVTRDSQEETIEMSWHHFNSKDVRSQLLNTSPEDRYNDVLTYFTFG